MDSLFPSSTSQSLAVNGPSATEKGVCCLLIFSLLFTSFPSSSCCVLCSGTSQPLFVKPWTVAHQDPMSMRFPRKKHRSGLPFPNPLSWAWPLDLLWPTGYQQTCYKKKPSMALPTFTWPFLLQWLVTKRALLSSCCALSLSPRMDKQRAVLSTTFNLQTHSFPANPSIHQLSHSGPAKLNLLRGIPFGYFI